MYQNQQLVSLLPNSWIASDKLDTDDDALTYTENVCSSPIKTSVVSLIFIITIGISQPTPSTVILGAKLPISLGEIGSLQGSQSESPYIKRVVSNGSDNNKYVAYSVPKAYNGKQEDIASEEGAAMKKRINVSLNTIVYGSLSAIGLGAVAMSLISTYGPPIFDRNIAKVLLPMSFGFLAMVFLDYFARGKENARS